MRNYREVLTKIYSRERNSVAIMGKKVLGPIELKPKENFSDYKAKYNSNAKLNI